MAGSRKSCLSSYAEITEIMAIREGVEFALRHQWRKILIEAEAEVVHDVLLGKGVSQGGNWSPGRTRYVEKAKCSRVCRLVL